MVAFPDQPVTQLTVVDSSNNPVIQIGPGPTISAVGTSGSIVIDASNVTPAQYFYNTDKTNWGFINLGHSQTGVADLGINSGQYTSTQYPTLTLRSRVFFQPPNIGTQLGHIRTDTQQVVGGNHELRDNMASMVLRNATGTVIAQTLVINQAAPNSPDAAVIFLQAGDTALNGPVVSITKDWVFLQNKANTLTLVQDSDGYLKVLNQGWINLTVNANWSTPTGAGRNPLQYRLMPDGTCILRGGALSTTGALATVATLPVAARPNMRAFGVCNGSAGVVPFYIDSNGDIVLQTFTAGNSASFDFVRFPLATLT